MLPQHSLVYELCICCLAMGMVVMTIVGMIRLWPRRRETFMRKRHPLIYYGLPIAILTVIVERSVLLAVVRNFGPALLILLPYVIMEICRWTIVCLVLTRSWLLWFHIRWTMSTLDHEWQHLLNSNVNDGRIRCVNWFLSSRRKYGSFSVMLRRFGWWSMLCFVLCSAEWVHMVTREMDNDGLVDAAGMNKTNFAVMVTFTPSVLAEIIILKMTPHFDDRILLHWEYQVQIKAVLLLAVSILIRNVCVMMGFDIRAIALPINMLLCFAPIFVQLYLVPFKIPPNHAERGLIRTNSASPTSSVSTPRKNSTADMSHMTLQRVLSHPRSVHLFMVHLSKEYSMEELLAFIEFNQYLGYLKDIQLSLMHEGHKDRISELSFPDNVPLSEILECRENGAEIHRHGVTQLDMAKIKAHKLYLKYMAAGSEFEIKLSPATKETLAARFGDLKALLDDKKCTEEDLILMFDNCKAAVRRSLIFSMARFRETDEFEEAIAAITGDPKRTTVSMEVEYAEYPPEIQV